MKTIKRTIKNGRNNLIQRFHPWIFSGAIKETDDPDDVYLARLETESGDFLAWAQYNHDSKIRLRILSLKESDKPDLDWYTRTLTEVFGARRIHLTDATNALRLCFADADGLPGLIIDYFNGILVLQFLTRGIDGIKDQIIEPIKLAFKSVFSNLALRAIYEKSTGDGRRLEGLEPHEGLIFGDIKEPLELCENGIPFTISITGQKTGFYSDQRQNRLSVSKYCNNRSVLDICSYTGGFAAYAAFAGAKDLTLIDDSSEALEHAQLNLKPYEIPKQFVIGDAFEVLRTLHKEGKSYDVIVLDPPKLAPKRKNLDNAFQGYKDLNLMAIKLLRPHGYLASFSCSGLVSAQDLKLWIAFAAKDAGVRLNVIEQLHQAPCHPIPLGYPEAEYLKGFILQRE